jgi:hypothetical protein
MATGADAGANQYQTDHSSINVLADRVLIEDNIMLHGDSTVLPVATAIELHGSDHLVRNNKIDGYNKGLNMAALVMHGRNQTVIDNVITNCRWTVDLWSASSYDLDRLKFSGNICTQADFSSYSADYKPMFDFGHLVTGSPADNIEITGNQFISEWQEPADTTEGHGIYCEYFKHVIIANNLLRDINGRAISIGAVNADEAYITIRDNTIIDCCQTNDSSFKEAIAFLLSTTAVKRVVVEDNTIENTSTVHMTKGIRINANVTTMRVRNNTIRNVTTHGQFNEGENGFTDTIVQDVFATETITTGATPSVGNGAKWYYLDYAGAQTITDFSDSYDGQKIVLLTADANPTIQHGAGVIELEGGSDFPMSTAGDMLHLMMRSGVWYELSRRNA